MDADIVPSSKPSLSVRRAVSRSIHPGRLARPQTLIDGGRRQLPTGTRLRAKRRVARDIAQDAQRHPWLSTRFYRAANSMGCPFHSFGDFRDGGFRFWNGIQAFVGKRGQRDVITHELISKPTNSQ